MAGEGLLGGGETQPAKPTGDASTSAAPSKEAGDVAWQWSEGVPGTGAAPEWFRADKYKTIADQAAAYPELEKKIGEKAPLPPEPVETKAPDKYEIHLPEGIDWPLDEADPMLKDMTDSFREMGLSQDQFDIILAKYAHWNGAANLVDRENELKALGAEGPKIIEELTGWGTRNLSAEDWRTMQQLASSAPAVKLLHALTRAASVAQTVPGSLDGSAADDQARQQLKALHGKRGYGPDDDKKAMELAAKLVTEEGAPE